MSTDLIGLDTAERTYLPFCRVGVGEEHVHHLAGATQPDASFRDDVRAFFRSGRRVVWLSPPGGCAVFVPRSLQIAYSACVGCCQPPWRRANPGSARLSKSGAPTTWWLPS